jgi:hypothetical protein
METGFADHLERNYAQRTFILPALRAAHSLRDSLEPSVPATQAPQRMRLGSALMTADSAFEYQRILAKLIAQFVDTKSAGHAADCYEPPPRRPSSTGIDRTLYKVHSSPNRYSRNWIKENPGLHGVIPLLHITPYNRHLAPKPY